MSIYQTTHVLVQEPNLDVAVGGQLLEAPDGRHRRLGVQHLPAYPVDVIPSHFVYQRDEMLRPPSVTNRQDLSGTVYKKRILLCD